MFKNISTSISIVGALFVIRYATEYPIMGVVCMLTTVDALVFYSFIYEKAFQVPDRTEMVKRQVKVMVEAVKEGQMVKRSMLKIIKSIPPLAVKVGDFHTMERTGTLTFLNFVFCQIVGLLVAFK